MAHQTLLGVTGSGKTFTIANVIATLNRPAMLLAPNKTLAAQLYAEMKDFFRKMRWNISFLIMIITSRKPMFRAVILFIEKDSAVNEQIDQMRLSAVKSFWSAAILLLWRRFRRFMVWASRKLI